MVAQVGLDRGVTAIGKSETGKQLRTDVAIHAGRDSLFCEWLRGGCGCQSYWVKLGVVDHPVGLLDKIFENVDFGFGQVPEDCYGLFRAYWQRDFANECHGL